MRATLFIVGAFFELAGILLVASPDLVPQAERASRWLGARYRRAVNRLRRLIGRPRTQFHSIGAAGEASAAADLSIRKTISQDASLEEKVDFLLRRDQEAQRDVNEVRKQIARIERESPERIEELRSEMKQHVADVLAATHREHLPLRLVGIVALVLGLACVTVANFV